MIHFLMPFLLCLLPVLAAVLVAVSLPEEARKFYINRVRSSSIDQLILAFGCGLFVLQMLFSFQALRWRGTNFDERPDRWLSSLAQAAEWFPLLGLLGTVAGIMQTFSSVTDKTEAHEIINLYAPAITATGSGLLMALANILPTWIVTVGRELIRTLAGDPAPPPVATPTPQASASGTYPPIPQVRR
jgi:hypothetical protein